jgi:hypothetical protein
MGLKFGQTAFVERVDGRFEAFLAVEFDWLIWIDCKDNLWITNEQK